MNVITGLRAYLSCKDAATANHIGGWAGSVVAGLCGWLVASGHVEEFRSFVCNASQDDLGLAVATIGIGASLLNSGSTKALTPRTETKDQQAEKLQPDDKLANFVINSDLERVKQQFPPRKRR